MRYPLLLLTLLLALAGSVQAQTVIGNEPPVKPPAEAKSPLSYGLHSGMAVNILMTNFGFGLGGQYRHMLGPMTQLTLDLQITGLRNVSEQTFTDFFGQQVTPHKFNRVLAFPLMLGLRERIFSNSVADNFRIHLTGAVGPSLAFVYPYFKDYNQNGLRDQGEQVQFSNGNPPLQLPYEPINDILSGWKDGHLRTGVAGRVAIAVDLGKRMKNIGTISFGYYFHYYSKGMQMLEPTKYATDSNGNVIYDPSTNGLVTVAASKSQKYFGTPVISFTIGGMW